MYLHLVRHASSYPSHYKGDEKRVLDDYGILQSKNISKIYKHYRHYPDVTYLNEEYRNGDKALRPPELIIASSADRALQTIEPFSMQLKVDVVASEKLFLVDEDQIISFVRKQTVTNLMLVNHNPVISELCGDFLVRDESLFIFQGMSLGEIAIFKFECEDFAEIDYANAKLIMYAKNEP